MIKKRHFYLAVIFFTALLLRIYNLGEIPLAFDHDEIAISYTGYYILQNGVDLYGNKWPLLYFNRYGDYPAVLPMYLAGLGMKVFGINEFGARFPTALFGAIAVIPLYYFARLIFKKDIYAYLSAGFLVFLPWHITMSRVMAEGIIGTTILLIGLCLLLSGLKLHKIYFIISGFLLALSTYFFYASFRLLVPLILLPLPLLYRRSRHFLLISLLWFFSFIATVYIGTTFWGRGRFDQTSIFTNPKVRAETEGFVFNEGQNRILTARIFHNKIIGYSREFISQYLGYFSSGFIFLPKALPFWYSVPDQGAFYFSFGLMLLGLFMPLVFPVDKKIYLYIWYLLFITPIPSALTLDNTPNLHRTLFLIVPFLLICTVGLVNLLKRIHRFGIRPGQIAFGITLLIFGFETIYFLHQYSNHMDSYKSETRFDQHREIAKYAAANLRKYSKIYMPVNGYLPVYYFFYTRNFDKELAGRFGRDFRYPGFDNIEFVDNECPTSVISPAALSVNNLFIDFGNCTAKAGFYQQMQFFRKDTTAAFRSYINN